MNCALYTEHGRGVAGRGRRHGKVPGSPADLRRRKWPMRRASAVRRFRWPEQLAAQSASTAVRPNPQPRVAAAPTRPVLFIHRQSATEEIDDATNNPNASQNTARNPHSSYTA